MQVVDVIPRNKNKYIVITDCEIAFVVYKGDLHKYAIEVGGGISDEKWNAFVRDVLIPRAKTRGMYLLQAREYSVGSFKSKLMQDGYPETVVSEVVSYMAGFHYLDDERYARAFIRTYGKGKSRRELQIMLSRKGVSEECIAAAMIELSENGDLCDESSVIERLLEKKHFDGNKATFEEKMKMKEYLLRKGFSYESISCAICKNSLT